MPARVNVPGTSSKRTDRVFNSPLETGEGMKIVSPVKSGRAGREMLLRANSELVRCRVPQGQLFVWTVTGRFWPEGKTQK
ncbi:MAG: hypothetical protein JO141_24230 [Bradyrhizobium sp.]|nr:hypothetical protein [Bradyrhizobium sp.]